MKPQYSLGNGKPSFIPPPPVAPEISAKTNRNDGNRKNFIRFRFQIDCVAAVDVNVDELVRVLICLIISIHV